jgi:hypothetical protein
MSFSISIRDNATPKLRALVDAMKPGKINPLIGRIGVNAVKKHFYHLNQTRPNKLGGKRTNYWYGAANGTHYSPSTNGVVIGVNMVGIRYHYYGGTITPKGTNRETGKPLKYLTIPARAEAHGKRAGEFHNLRFEVTDQGPALVEALATDVIVGRKAKGLAVWQKAKATGGGVFFWLRRSVSKGPDHSVLPTSQELQRAIIGELETYAKGKS